MKTDLELRTLGGVTLLDAGRPLDGPGVRKPLALLILLAGAGIRGLSRDKLLGYLWPEADGERGRNVLRQTLYALRRDLGAPSLLLPSAASIRLNPAVIRTDLTAFREAVSSGAWETAAELYRGPFADGFYLSDAPEFERWVELERQDLAVELRRGLVAVARRATLAGDHQAAAEWWRRSLRHDPLNAGSPFLWLKRSNRRDSRPWPSRPPARTGRCCRRSWAPGGRSDGRRRSPHHGRAGPCQRAAAGPA